MNYFVGIDNSCKTHEIQILDKVGNKINSFSVTNDLSGFEKLKSNIHKFENPIIGFELSHGPIVEFFRLNNYKMFSLNPLKVKRFKQAFRVSGNKTDPIDANAIAQYLFRNHNHLYPLTFNSKEIEKLKTLAISHNRLTKEHARCKNRLLFLIRQYFPLYETLFCDHGSKILLKFILQYPTLKVLRNADHEEIVKFLKLNYCRNQKYTDRVLTKIKIYDHLISDDIQEALQFEAKAIAQLILTLKDNLKEVVKEMKRISDHHRLGKYFQSLPGSGDILSSKLLALFGDYKNRYSSVNGAQCLFGTAPMNYQSGTYHKIIMRRACNKPARAVLYKYAFSTLRYSKWAREYYDKQRAKGKTHSVSIRALSNKWVKIIFAIWKNEIFYDERKKLLKVA